MAFIDLSYIIEFMLKIIPSSKIDNLKKINCEQIPKHLITENIKKSNPLLNKKKENDAE